MKTQQKPMRASSLLLVAAILFFAFFSVPLGHAGASDFKLVAHPSVNADAVSAADLKRIYLLERTSLSDGTRVVPVLQKAGRAHDAFVKDFLNLNDEALLSYYRTLVFTGRGSMPKALASDAEVVAYVARTKGAIGYVDSNSNTEGVKVLAVGPVGTTERALLKRVEPEYPDTLQRLQIGGTVRLMVTISPKGSVDGVQLLGGNPILAESAIKAVKQWVYAPGPSQTASEVTIPFAPNK